MENKRNFFKCEICGNIIELIENGGGKLVCCGKEMIQLDANTQDAAKEKHVPEIKLEGNELTVNVGSVSHPMTQEHHISWIAVAQGGQTQRISLDKTGTPQAKFIVENEQFTVYAYCNLHGLWSAVKK